MARIVNSGHTHGRYSICDMMRSQPRCKRWLHALVTVKAYAAVYVR